jgi:hypothetical protein
MISPVVRCAAAGIANPSANSTPINARFMRSPHVSKAQQTDRCATFSASCDERPGNLNAAEEISRSLRPNQGKVNLNLVRIFMV